MSTSLSTLRARTRRYLDETTADRWTNTAVDAYINEGIHFCQSEIDRANPDYFLRTTTFTASGGSTQGAYPSTIFGHKIRNMQLYKGSTAATGMPYRVSPGQLSWIYQNQYYSGTPLSYYPFAGYMVWAPALDETSTFRFVYAKKEADLSSDSDTVDAIPDEYTHIISLYAAVLALEGKNIPSGAVRAMLERRVMHMQNDSQPTDPFVIPQVRID